MPPDRPALSRDRIVEAGVAFADRHGLSALTMRKLAAELGVEAMSLYNHISNKADLLDAMVDAMVGQIDAPRPGRDWKAELRRRAITARDLFLAHPWMPGLWVQQSNPGPHMLRYVDATIGCIVEAGFSYPMADEIWHALDSHIYGFTLQELNFPFEPETYAQQARDNLDMIPVEIFPHLHEMARLVATGQHKGINDFTLGLDILLDGFESRLKHVRRDQTRHTGHERQAVPEP